jgi:hypothetical protein
MIVGISCTKGAFGQLKSSKQEFEILDTTSTHATFRIKPWENEATRLR